MANYRALAAAAAQRAGIPVNIFLRQIGQESGFNPRARSGAGAVGIAQIVPRYHPDVNPNDPVASLNWAARDDAQNLRKYGNWQNVLSVYNSGRPWAQGQGISETRNYVHSILGGGNLGGAPTAGAAPGAGPGPGSSSGPGLASSRQALAMNLIAASQATARGQTPDYSQTFGLVSALRGGGSATGAVAPLPAAPVAGRISGKPSLNFLEPFANRFGLQITSTTGGQHVRGSYHYQGRAVDFGGNTARMAALQRYAISHAGQFTEAFYTGPGSAPYFVKNGHVYPIAQLDASVRAHHTNHVHLAR